MVLSEQEQAGFNFAVDLYTRLICDQQEMVLLIVRNAYAKGISDGVAYAQDELRQQLVQAQDEEFEESVESVESDRVAEPIVKPISPPPKYEPPNTPSPAEELIAKMKGVKR
jgi:hypothetical protein